MHNLFIIAVVYALVVGGMYVFQRQLLYFPDKTAAEPEAHNLKMHSVTFNADDGVKLNAWYGAAAPGQKTILYFHGNAQNLPARHNKFRTLMAQHFGLLALSYRGYGGSEGSPSEQGIYKDARAAIHYLEAQGITRKDIVLYGESLGTGVAVEMAKEFPDLNVVILEAPYTSVPARGQEVYPYVPVKLLMKDRFNTLSKIGDLKQPILILHGEADTTVPPTHSRTLLEHITAPHRAFYFPGVQHTDFPLEDVAAKVREFVDNPPAK